MSARAVNWALRQRAGGAPQKLVLLALARLADKAGEAQCSNAAISQICEIEAEGVRRNLCKLEARGLIARSPSLRDDGGRGANRIVLACPKARDHSEPATAAGGEWGRA